MLWKKGACPKTKGSSSSKKVAIQSTPLNSQYKIVAIYFFLCEAKNSNTDQKSWVKTNKEINKKKEKKGKKNSIKKNLNKKLPTTQMMRSLDIEERGTSHFCIWSRRVLSCELPIHYLCILLPAQTIFKFEKKSNQIKSKSWNWCLSLSLI